MKPKQRRSGKCHNCENLLTEEQNFCPNCGQSNTDNNVTFWVLIKEFVDNYLGIDSKMAHSFLPFLLRPGKLTNRFQAGQIKHFIHPIRLYFVLSLLYFFVISYLLSGINFSSIEDEGGNFGGTTNIGNLIDGERLSQLSDSVKINLIPDSLRANYIGISSFKVLYDSLESNLEEGFFEELKVDIDGVDVPTNNAEGFIEKSHRLARDKNISDAAFMDSISSEININGDEGMKLFKKANQEHFNQQVRKVFENDEGFKGFVLGNLPFMMFILIPLFAGVLKLIYVRRNHLYIKHVVHALHVHAFAYFVYAIGLLIMFKFLTPQVFPNMDHSTWRLIVGAFLFVGVSTYVYISFLRTYEQGWFKTLVKFNIVGFIYAIFLQVFFYIELAISFWYY